MIVTADDFIELEKLIYHDAPGLRLLAEHAFPVFEELTSHIAPHLVITDAGGAVEWFATKQRARSDIASGRNGAAADSLRRLAGLASKYWKPAGTHPQRALGFIKDADLRRIAEEDWSRAVGSAQREDAKTTAIAAGSTVEAISLDILEGLSEIDANRLRDHLNSLPPAQRQNYSAKKDSALKDWPFAFLILALGPDGMKALTSRTRDIGQQLRDFRNYVHPGKSRSRAPLSAADGRIAVGFAEKVIEEVEAWAPRSTTFPP